MSLLITQLFLYEARYYFPFAYVERTMKFKYNVGSTIGVNILHDYLNTFTLTDSIQYLYSICMELS